MRRLVLFLVAIVALAGCYGRVNDPRREESTTTVDIARASVTYGNDTIRFGLVLQDGVQPDGATRKTWEVSTNGDKRPEWVVSFGATIYSIVFGRADPDAWFVTATRSGAEPVCEGQLPEGGWDGHGTALAISSSCLASSGRLPATVRVKATIDAQRLGQDATGYTALVGRS